MPKSRGRKQKGSHIVHPRQRLNVPAATPQQPSFLVRPGHKLWFRISRLFGAVIGVFGLVAGIYGIWGPIWPTAPEFSPLAPSFSLAFDVPFNVANKSIVSDIKNLTISCHIIFARLSISHKVLQNVTVGIEGRPYDPKHPAARNNLKASSMSSYSCPLTSGPIGGFGPTPEFPDDKLEAATIEFLTEYDSRWPWGDRTAATSGVFALNAKTNPQQWTQGVPLQ